MTREERRRKLYTNRFMIFIVRMAKIGYKLIESKNTEIACLTFRSTLKSADGHDENKIVVVDSDNILLCSEEEFYDYISSLERRLNGDVRKRSLLSQVVSSV